ncbi:hypothetical protein OS493_031309 [Desmophyllum pertusum]|uniref:Uncharacterized protein n=1 Tax=Desmophyllum pertusum TaxID=174260 RepID=A0A9X0CR93_9CNID|nr:hypothetical protein OS493_031309 [Desmophyllum pertusum]
MSHHKLLHLKIEFLESSHCTMGARIWFYFIVSLAISASPKGVSARSPFSGKNETDLDSGKVIVKNYNTVNLYRGNEDETALGQMRKKIESLEGRLDALEKSACKFDFEDGIDGWEKTGTVFNNQPTYGDNPTARNKGQPANQQGDWWIGGAEDRPSKTEKPGKVQMDGPQGSLTSPSFNITGKDISFLIGGGCDIKLVRAELIIDHKAVKTSTGNCTETMTRKHWDVGAFIGQRARVKLVDRSSGDWGHINFDDLRGDISCGPN